MPYTIIAIDGPAGSGKSTIAKELSKSLGIAYIDSGAIYRALTYYGMQEFESCKGNESQIAEYFSKNPESLDVHYEAGAQIIKLNGHLLQAEIRTAEITKEIRWVANHSSCRDIVNKLMKDIAKVYSVVVDGRDIGSVVFPETNNKFYLDASVEIRATRRALEMKIPTEGPEFKALKEEIHNRDESDRNRRLAPLIQAEDAHYIDTSNMSIGSVLSTLRDHLKQSSAN